MDSGTALASTSLRCECIASGEETFFRTEFVSDGPPYIHLTEKQGEVTSKERSYSDASGTGCFCQRNKNPSSTEEGFESDPGGFSEGKYKTRTPQGRLPFGSQIISKVLVVFDEFSDFFLHPFNPGESVGDGNNCDLGISQLIQVCGKNVA